MLKVIPKIAIKDLVSALLTWFASNARDLPWRRTLDPYCIWVSEIMLQQTQVKTVIPYWVRWMQELPTVAELINRVVTEATAVLDRLGSVAGKSV